MANEKRRTQDAGRNAENGRRGLVNTIKKYEIIRYNEMNEYDAGFGE